MENFASLAAKDADVAKRFSLDRAAAELSEVERVHRRGVYGEVVADLSNGSTCRESSARSKNTCSAFNGESKRRSGSFAARRDLNAKTFTEFVRHC